MIGERIRKLREELGLPLEVLAERAGIATGLLQKIEAGEVVPSVATLIHVARALGLTLTELLGKPAQEKMIVVRTSERKDEERRPRTGPSKSGYYYQRLASKEGIDAFLVTFEEKREEDRVYFQHEGKEFLYVLEGTLELCLEGDCVVLEPGDSVSYESKFPHALRGVGGPAKALVVIYGESQ
ncbi:XRE family transcriptional regulator [Thermosulfidibacter takaii ABI70S6]|uniref:XRE family transcriptional regulator n=1 Tax=Thermosulfidibacter takaii (strain DSM 17441 / JCM 13301 / NBRC 103674 / ABI70S6) TaxID=1298851 RepID=A0A0S3QTB2_THET7|nr:XRE family transcriptional regulator [Thermosulfidibacter takaii]BAT71570.1 XRE family transcriptional regulator [Thermosulfidibacter takaii ABI70S6]